MEANAGEYIKKYLHLKRFPRISFHCKLVPIQYREYEYGLFYVLRSWFFSHFLAGYVQGMSDLLSPILVVMENEVEAFWCFVGFMEKLVSHS